jgi:hypothetical protein
MCHEGREYGGNLYLCSHSLNKMNEIPVAGTEQIENGESLALNHQLAF